MTRIFLFHFALFCFGYLLSFVVVSCFSFVLKLCFAALFCFVLSCFFVFCLVVWFGLV